MDFLSEKKKHDNLSKPVILTFATEVSEQIVTNSVSEVTETVIEQVVVWQNRPLDDLYPVVYLDCIVIKVHQEKRVIKKSMYLALGINAEGQKELLGCGCRRRRVSNSGFLY